MDDLSTKVKDEHSKLVVDMQRVTEMMSRQISNFINKQHHPNMYGTTDTKSANITQESISHLGGGLQNTTQDQSTSNVYATQRAIDEANSIMMK